MYQQAGDSRKKAITIKLGLAEPDTLELPLSSTASIQVWHLKHRDGLSVMETNSSLKAVSLFLWLCIFFSDNHTNWRLFSVSNFHMAQLCFPSVVSLIMKLHFCNYRYFCTTAWEILVPVLYFLSEFYSDILQMERDSCITNKRTVFLSFPLHKCYFFQIFQKQPNTEASTLEQIFTVLNQKSVKNK